MTKASDNLYPKLLLDLQTVAPAAPSNEDWKLYAKPNGIFARSSNTEVGPFGAGGAGSYTFSGARVYNSTAINLSAGSETTLTYDSERWDTDAYHSTGADTDRLTAPATGKYRVGAAVKVTNSPGDPSYLGIFASTGTFYAIQTLVNSAGFCAGAVETTVDLSAADYVTCKVYVTNSSKQATANAKYSPEFWIQRVE